MGNGRSDGQTLAMHPLDLAGHARGPLSCNPDDTRDRTSPREGAQSHHTPDRFVYLFRHPEE